MHKRSRVFSWSCSLGEPCRKKEDFDTHAQYQLEVNNSYGCAAHQGIFSGERVRVPKETFESLKETSAQAVFWKKKYEEVLLQQSLGKIDVHPVDAPPTNGICVVDNTTNDDTASLKKNKKGRGPARKVCEKNRRSLLRIKKAEKRAKDEMEQNRQLI